MYNNAKGDVEKGEKKMLRVEAERQLMLPSTKPERTLMDPTPNPWISYEKNGNPFNLYHEGLTFSTSVNQNHTHVSPTMALHPPSGYILHPPAPSTQPNVPTYDYRTTTNVSPIVSYPSPPPSLDSPPHDTKVFHTVHGPQIIAQQA
jgi:solute carrier family 35 protein E1